MNEQFSITRRIDIDAAHRIPDHRSKCFNIHGHRYVIEATCVGPVIEKGEQRGMVLDFSFLKECMVTAIHDPCDHGMILWNKDPMIPHFYKSLTDAEEKYGEDHTPDFIEGFKILKVNFVPTAENLAKYWHEEVTKAIHMFFNGRLEMPPMLRTIRVHETPNCMAEYPV